jgi:hypothetical protein
VLSIPFRDFDNYISNKPGLPVLFMENIIFVTVSKALERALLQKIN